MRGLIVVLWRAGLRIGEALALVESDLEPARGALLVRRGKGGKRREVRMDEWGWAQLRPWLEFRRGLPIGPLFCVIRGPGGGRPWTSAAARTRLRRIALDAGVRRRFAPHQLRHAHAVELARERVPLNVIQRQLGHANLGVTSIYLQGIDSAEIVETVHSRRAPMIPAAVALLDADGGFCFEPRAAPSRIVFLPTLGAESHESVEPAPRMRPRSANARSVVQIEDVCASTRRPKGRAR
jgi:integrase